MAGGPALGAGTPWREPGARADLWLCHKFAVLCLHVLITESSSPFVLVVLILFA
jgi:hypothetical protein